MKPKFSMRIQQQRSPRSNPSTKADAVVARKWTNAKAEQLKAAVAWCVENGARGYAALKTGQFPLIKDRETINKRLDGKIVNGEERAYCTIITSEEDRSIVQFVKNKNRCMQAVNKELEKLILDVLRIRDYTNKKLKGGRKFVKLSTNARVAMEKGRQVEDMFNYCQIYFHGLVVDLLTLSNISP